MLESLFNKTRLQHWWFPLKSAKVLRTPILKNSCKRLLLFVLPQDVIANSRGEFGLDKTSTACKVIIFLKRTILLDQMQPSFIYKLKKVSFTFQVTFSLKF